MKQISQIEFDHLVQLHEKWLRTSPESFGEVASNSKFIFEECLLLDLFVNKSDLSYGYFRNVVFENISFNGCFFAHSTFEECRFNDCQFNDCELHESDWRQATGQKLIFAKCDFYNARMRECKFLNTTFNESKLDWVYIFDSDFRNSSYDNVSVIGTRITNTKLYTASRVIKLIEPEGSAKGHFSMIDLSEAGDSSEIMSDELFRAHFIKRNI